MNAVLLIEVLLAAIGVALNPPAVIAAVILVTSSRRKGLAFAGGWLVGLLVATGVVMLLEDVIAGIGGSSPLVALVKLAAGAGLLILAIFQWRKHAASADDAATPEWMESIAALSGARAFVSAAGYAALNPKTIAFIVAGNFAILGGVSGLAAQAVAAAVFAVVASLSVTAPVALASIAPDRFEKPLVAGGKWLRRNGSVIAVGIFAILGATLAYSGVTGLLG